MMKHTILILFLFLSLLCHGQSYKFFTTDRELSSSLINKIYQDRNGMIWIATEDGLNRYDGDHFGKVLWVKNYIGNLDPDKDYYRNNATKNDGNLYLKANYELYSGVNAYADLQYRHISYKMYGQNDKWNSVTNDGLQQLAIHEKFDFFNPKAGLSWQINRNNRIYGSFSVAHKEHTLFYYHIDKDVYFGIHQRNVYSERFVCRRFAFLYVFA